MNDVIVVGAGPGGAATACFLAQAGIDVLLLDKSTFPRDKTCGDGLTPRALCILDEIGVLGQATQSGYRVSKATVYAPNGTAVTTQVPRHDDLPQYMLTVPRLILDDLICSQAIARGATFHGGVHVTNIQADEQGVTVEGEGDGRRFASSGRMAVIATGANVKLLHNLGILKHTPPMILGARTYYEGLNHLSNCFEFHFDGVPLPGYSWIFPLSSDSANIGAGVFPALQTKRSGRTTAKGVLGQFLQHPRVRKMTIGARQLGPVKGYPLRTDFARAPTFGDRVLLVGESAGLVNPLTGEGVDFALESASVAAEHLLEMLNIGEFGKDRLKRYDRALRDRFQRLFVLSGRIRDWYMNAPILNRLVTAANRRDNLRAVFTDVVLGNTDAGQALSLRTIGQILSPW